MGKEPLPNKRDIMYNGNNTNEQLAANPIPKESPANDGLAAGVGATNTAVHTTTDTEEEESNNKEGQQQNNSPLRQNPSSWAQSLKKEDFIKPNLLAVDFDILLNETTIRNTNELTSHLADVSCLAILTIADGTKTTIRLLHVDVIGQSNTPLTGTSTTSSIHNFDVNKTFKKRNIIPVHIASFILRNGG